MRELDRNAPWLKWLAAVVLVFILVITAACGSGSGKPPTCNPPNTQTTTELGVVQEDFETFVVSLGAGAPAITAKQIAEGKQFTYSVNNFFIANDYVAIEVEVGYALDIGFGPEFDGATSTYKIVYSRDCAGDEFERVSAEPAKSGVNLEPPKEAKVL